MVREGKEIVLSRFLHVGNPILRDAYCKDILSRQLAE
jgi:hypothetical protein